MNGCRESKDVDTGYFAITFYPDLSFPDVRWTEQEAILGRSNTKSAANTKNFLPIVECSPISISISFIIIAVLSFSYSMDWRSNE